MILAYHSCHSASDTAQWLKKLKSVLAQSDVSVSECLTRQHTRAAGIAAGHELLHTSAANPPSPSARMQAGLPAQRGQVGVGVHKSECQASRHLALLTNKHQGLIVHLNWSWGRPSCTRRAQRPGYETFHRASLAAVKVPDCGNAIASTC